MYASTPVRVLTIWHNSSSSSRSSSATAVKGTYVTHQQGQGATLFMRYFQPIFSGLFGRFLGPHPQFSRVAWDKFLGPPRRNSRVPSKLTGASSFFLGAFSTTFSDLFRYTRYIESAPTWSASEDLSCKIRKRVFRCDPLLAAAQNLAPFFSEGFFFLPFVNPFGSSETKRDENDDYSIRPPIYYIATLHQ